MLGGHAGSAVGVSTDPGGARVLSGVAQSMDDQKSELACLVCRSRKVRCDRSLPTCRNCTRLGVPCPGYSAETESISRKEMQKSADDIFKAAGVEKRRVGSCAACRASKHRCSRNRPACRRCLHRGIECVYPSKGAAVASSVTSDDCHDHEEQALSSTGAVQIVPIRVSQALSEGTLSSPGIIPDPGLDPERLCSEILLNDHALRLRLVHTYFYRSHHLRCLSFLHQPTFLRSLDRDSVEQDFGEPLLYIMCALGARHLYFDTAAKTGLVMDIVPGSAWVETARKEVFSEIHTPTLQLLMALVLLCDYEIRGDQNALAFVSIGLLHRFIRLLSLDNPEPPQDPFTPEVMIQRETENRLVWACYFIDMFVGSGVEKNTCWRNELPNIPLPIPDQNFHSFAQSPPLFAREVEDAGIVADMKSLDLSAIMILIGRLRFRVLRLIRTPVAKVGTLWDPSGPFLQIIQQLDAIYANLPLQYQINEQKTPLTQNGDAVGAIFLLHLLIHGVVFDLCRISLAGFNFPLASAFQDAPPSFRLQCQDRCRYHADQVSELLRKGLSMQRGPFDDMFCGDATLECSKIQIIYAATVNRSPQVLQTTRRNLDTNLRFLEVFHCGKEGPSPLIRSLIPLCMLFGFGEVAERYKEPFSAIEDDAEVTGPKDVDHLSTFAPFRKAKAQLKAKRSSTSQSSGRTHASLAPHLSRQPSSAVTPSPRPDDKAFSTSSRSSALPMLQREYPAYTPEPQQQLPPPQQHHQHQHQHQHQQIPLPVPSPLHSATMNTASVLPQNSMMAPMSLTPPNGTMPMMDQMMPDGLMMQSTVDDYLRAAEEMSNYLTWDMSELPPWMNFNDAMPPGR